MEDKQRILGKMTGLLSLFWCLLLMSNWSCQSAEQAKSGLDELTKTSTPAFYHWKATFNPTQSEKQTLNSLNLRKLYIRFFDVDWDARTRQPVPKAFIRFGQKPILETVPVVFITNRTLINGSPDQLSALAVNISRSIARISHQNDILFNEVQIDCDWTLRTRDRYFRLLTLLKTQLRCTLSATIRLHQIKYADQTGVPPVARGMLMVYNMADWKNPDTRNSIYDPEVADRYLAFVDRYPIPLDVVLPLFRWTVVYRSGRFLSFLNNLDRQTLQKSRFLEAQVDSNRFVAQRDTAAFGFSVRRGDLFRAESVSTENLVEQKQKLFPRIKNGNLTFALYHLDSTVLAAYPRETLQTLLRPSPRRPSS